MVFKMQRMVIMQLGRLTFAKKHDSNNHNTMSLSYNYFCMKLKEIM